MQLNGAPATDIELHFKGPGDLKNFFFTAQPVGIDELEIVHHAVFF